MLRSKTISIARRLKLEPVLVDVGASGSPPPLWQPIASLSTYIGFDPDARDFPGRSLGIYKKATLIRKAVTANVEAQEVTFHLTAAPQCSSTLPPDTMSLKQYEFANLFTVIGSQVLPATTLGNVIAEENLGNVDWLKLDTQGTDLRIYASLPPDIRSHVLAVDFEPGLVDAYSGEDLFCAVHPRAQSDGFWLSRLTVKGAVRIQDRTASDLRQLGHSLLTRVLGRTVRSSPCWVEARYLRTLEYALDNGFAKREVAMLWLFALLDGQFGFALDIAGAVERRYADAPLAAILRAETLVYTRQRVALGQVQAVATIANYRFRQALGTFRERAHPR